MSLWLVHHVPSPRWHHEAHNNIEQVHSNYKKQNALEKKYRVTMDAVHGVQVIVVNDMYNIKQ